MLKYTLLAIVSFIFATLVQGGFLDEVVPIPTCARRCAAKLPPGCEGNPTCVCGDDVWMNSAQCCIQTTCSAAEILITQQFAAQLCKVVNQPPKAPHNCPKSATPAFSVKLPAKKTYGAIGQYQYDGCYKPGWPWNVVIWGDWWLDVGRMTQEACWNWCDRKGYDYMGLWEGNKCFCGRPRLDRKAQKQPDDSLCQTRCDGDQEELCGGRNMMAVFKKERAERQHRTT